MADLYKNKYRIASARLQHWDYGWNAPYFITICTKNRELYFGDVQNGEMILSDIGIIANSLWTQIPDHFPFVELDAFVVMPNHIHGILVIENVRRNHQWRYYRFKKPYVVRKYFAGYTLV